MKKLLLPIILFFTVNVYGQYVYSPNTFFVNPPVWAVQDTCAGNTYNFSPMNCATINHHNGDTLFLNLNSIPCNFYKYCDNGNVTGYWVQSTAAIYDVPENDIKVYTMGDVIYIDNPDLDIEFVGVFDLCGRNIFSTTTQSDKQLKFDISALQKGLYFVNCRQKNNMTFVQKIILN